MGGAKHLQPRPSSPAGVGRPAACAVTGTRELVGPAMAVTAADTSLAFPVRVGLTGFRLPLQPPNSMPAAITTQQARTRVGIVFIYAPPEVLSANIFHLPTFLVFLAAVH